MCQRYYIAIMELSTSPLPLALNADACSSLLKVRYVSLLNALAGEAIPYPPNDIKSWLSISKVTKPTTNIVAKFQRYASRATFPSAFVRKCLEADPTKDCYENHLTTGTRIDGEIISLDAISRYSYWAVDQFRKALKERRNFNSGTFTFRGYDGSLWIEVKDKDDNNNYYKAGDIAAGFSKEYRGCANGYYYALIDDEHFIGIDID